MSRRAPRTSSKRVLFWKNAFPDLLCCINTFPGYYVFVEGPSDRNFFQDYLIHKGADKIIRLRRRNYIPDFDFGPFLYRYKVDTSWDRNTMSPDDKHANYKSVIECIKEFNLNKNITARYQNIECFGIVDRDCGQHESDINSIISSCSRSEISIYPNLVQTEFHDRETTLLRHSLLRYAKRVNNNDFNDALKNILLFTTKQGLLEDSSHKFELRSSMYRTNPSAFRACMSRRIFFTHGYFDDDTTLFRKYISMQSMDGKCEFISYVNNFFSSNSGDIFNDYKNFLINIFNDGCINLFNSHCSNEEDFNNKFMTKISNWLVSEPSCEYEKQFIDWVFKYTNGHFLLRLLLDWNNLHPFFCDSNGNLFAFDSNPHTSEIQILSILFDKNDNYISEELYNCLPISKLFSHYKYFNT